MDPGDAGTNPTICDFFIGPCAYVLWIGSNVKLQSYWWELGPWGKTDTGSAQASY